MNKGIIFAIISAFCFSGMLALLKYLTAVPITTMLFVRYLVSLLWILGFAYYRRGSGQLIQWRISQLHRPYLIAVRIFSAFMAVLCIYYSTRYTSLLNITLLSLTYPLFIPLLAYMAFKIKTSRQVLGGILLGFIGVVVFLHPNSSVFHLVNFLIVLGALFASVAVLSVRVLTKVNSVETLLFYYFLAATLLLGGICLFHWQHVTLNQWGWLLLTGILGTAYQDLLSRALSVERASIIAPIMFLSIIFSAVFDWWLWHAIPGLLAYIGTALIFMGMMIVLHGNKIRGEQNGK